MFSLTETERALQKAEESAKAAGKGLHEEGVASHVREITWDLGEGGGLRLVEQHKLSKLWWSM